MERPALQRLQAMGTTFTNHQICSAVCTSSRSNIFAGQHIVHSGMFDNTNFAWQGNLSTEVPTMGHRMRQAGYYQRRLVVAVSLTSACGHGTMTGPHIRSRLLTIP